MIVIKVELWPFGDEEKVKELAKLHIVNDDTGDNFLGNYVVSNLKPGGTTEMAKIYEHPRRLGVLHLVAAALKRLGY